MHLDVQKHVFEYFLKYKYPYSKVFLIARLSFKDFNAGKENLYKSFLHILKCYIEILKVFYLAICSLLIITISNLASLDFSYVLDYRVYAYTE